MKEWSMAYLLIIYGILICPYDELSRPWIDEDDNFHESQCKGWDNESLTMVFCSGTLQSF